MEKRVWPSEENEKRSSKSFEEFTFLVGAARRNEKGALLLLLSLFLCFCSQPAITAVALLPLHPSFGLLLAISLMRAA